MNCLRELTMWREENLNPRDRSGWRESSRHKQRTESSGWRLRLILDEDMTGHLRATWKKKQRWWIKCDQRQVLDTLMRRRRPSVRDGYTFLCPDDDSSHSRIEEYEAFWRATNRTIMWEAYLESEWWWISRVPLVMAPEESKGWLPGGEFLNRGPRLLTNREGERSRPLQLGSTCWVVHSEDTMAVGHVGGAALGGCARVTSNRSSAALVACYSAENVRDNPACYSCGYLTFLVILYSMASDC